MIMGVVINLNTDDNGEVIIIMMDVVKLTNTDDQVHKVYVKMIV